MPHTIDIARRAMTDIQARIAWLTSQDSASAAARWHAGILTTIRTLADNPERCPQAEEASDLGINLRELLHRRRRSVFRILFTVEESVVHILRVRHAAQDRLGPRDV